MRDFAPIVIVLSVLVLILLVVGFYALILAYANKAYRRANDLLAGWAARNGYRIIESEPRSFRKGPFFWTSSQSQVIYHVSVQDATGNIRRGWVRCGNYLFGPWNDEVDVRWDDQ